MATDAKLGFNGQQMAEDSQIVTRDRVVVPGFVRTGRRVHNREDREPQQDTPYRQRKRQATGWTTLTAYVWRKIAHGDSGLVLERADPLGNLDDAPERSLAPALSEILRKLNVQRDLLAGGQGPGAVEVDV